MTTVWTLQAASMSSEAYRDRVYLAAGIRRARPENLPAQERTTGESTLRVKYSEERRKTLLV